jgi:hypothetical protein
MFDFLSVAQDGVQNVQLEEVGGRIHPQARSDFLQALAFGQRGGGGGGYNADAIMAQTKVAISMLVKEDPNVINPSFLVNDWFRLTEVPIGDRDSGSAKVWYKNDLRGRKFFASTYIPAGKTAAEAAGALWEDTNWCRVNDVNEVLDIVVSELMKKSRLEHHVMPNPHPLGLIHADGIEFDKREALTLSWIEEVGEKENFKINGKKAKGYLLWMKSVTHPNIPSEEEKVRLPGRKHRIG